MGKSGGTDRHAASSTLTNKRWEKECLTPYFRVYDYRYRRMQPAQTIKRIPKDEAFVCSSNNTVTIFRRKPTGNLGNVNSTDEVGRGNCSRTSMGRRSYGTTLWPRRWGRGLAKCANRLVRSCIAIGFLLKRRQYGNDIPFKALEIRSMLLVLTIHIRRKAFECFDLAVARRLRDIVARF